MKYLQDTAYIKLGMLSGLAPHKKNNYADARDYCATEGIDLKDFEEAVKESGETCTEKVYDGDGRLMYILFYPDLARALMSCYRQYKCRITPKEVLEREQKQNDADERQRRIEYIQTFETSKYFSEKEIADRNAIQKRVAARLKAEGLA